MQRSFSLHHSFILMFLGLSIWLGIQGLLPRSTPPSRLPAEASGSQSASSQDGDQARTEPAETEPAQAEPAKAEPAKAEPAKTEPAKTEPAKIKFAKTEPSHPGLTLERASRGHRNGLNLLSEKALGQGGLWLPQGRWLFPSKSLQSGVVGDGSQFGAMGRVLVDLSDRKLFLYVNGDLKTEYAVAIGQAEWETPVGQYRVGEMQQQPAWEHPLTGKVVPAGPENPLGAAWIGFLADGDYHFGIHGTLDESLMGEAVSHGCVRMRNADILALYKVVQPDWPLEVVP